MTIDEQIENLKSLGLQIDDEEYAKRILNDISYFRLIKAFSLNLKPRNGFYHKDVKFSQIVELYLFNANFRQLLFPLIEKIEINARCRIVSIIVVVEQKHGYPFRSAVKRKEPYHPYCEDSGCTSCQLYINKTLSAYNSSKKWLCRLA